MTLRQRSEIPLAEQRASRIGIAVGGFILWLLCGLVGTFIFGERLLVPLGILIGVTFGIALYIGGDPKYMI